MNKISGRKILIMGGTSGIGPVAAREPASLGASLIVAGRDRERDEQVGSSIGPLPWKSSMPRPAMRRRRFISRGVLSAARGKSFLWTILSTRTNL